MHRDVGCRRPRRGWGLAAALVVGLASATAGTAAVRLLIFADEAPVADADLAELRGGFTLPNLPVKVHFGFTYSNQITMPGMPDMPKMPTQTFVPEPTSPDVTIEADTGGKVQIGATGNVEFSDPTRARVTRTDVVNGEVAGVSETEVDLTRQPLTIKTGVAGSQIKHVIGPDEIATLMKNTINHVEQRSESTLTLTLSGVTQMKTRLPSRGLTSSMDNLRQALSLR